jgi:hypothetical protein
MLNFLFPITPCGAMERSAAVLAAKPQLLIMHVRECAQPLSVIKNRNLYTHWCIIGAPGPPHPLFMVRAIKKARESSSSSSFVPLKPNHARPFVNIYRPAGINFKHSKYRAHYPPTSDQLTLKALSAYSECGLDSNTHTHARIQRGCGGGL